MQTMKFEGVDLLVLLYPPDAVGTMSGSLFISRAFWYSLVYWASQSA